MFFNTLAILEIATRTAFNKKKQQQILEPARRSGRQPSLQEHDSIKG